jgi:hypothetical protein
VSPPAFRLLRKSEPTRNWKQDMQTGSRILFLFCFFLRERESGRGKGKVRKWQKECWVYE